MELSRRIILVLVLAVVATVIVLPCFAEEKKDEKNIWTEGEPRGPGPGPRPGPGRGPGPGPGRGPRRFELTDEEIDRIMKGLQESNPEKAKELAKLRETDPNQFSFELRRHGREEFEKISKKRMAKFWSERREKFLEWLGKAVPREAQELAKLKDISPDLYAEKFELIRRKYWRIFVESKRNPELADVLLEDLRLKRRRDELLRNIKAVRSEREKEKLVAELQEVVAGRFDLLVRRKQLAFEGLLKRLEELRKHIRESRGEITRWRDEKFKNENVKKRTLDLLEETPKLNWD